jgi:methionine-rich copper-binding protein CopC
MTSPSPSAPAPRRLLQAVLLLVAVLSPSVLLAGPAAAHTRLGGSVPAAGAAVSGELSEVVLSFTGAVRAELVTVALTGPDGADGADGTATVRGTDVVLPVQAPLEPGAWTVAYRVVADDGHPISGTVDFTVTASAADPADAAAPPSSASPSSASPSSSSPSTAASPPAPDASTPAPAAGPVDLASSQRDAERSLAVPLLVALVVAVAAGTLVLRRRAASRDGRA